MSTTAGISGLMALVATAPIAAGLEECCALRYAEFWGLAIAE